MGVFCFIKFLKENKPRTKPNQFPSLHLWILTEGHSTGEALMSRENEEELTGDISELIIRIKFN